MILRHLPNLICIGRIVLVWPIVAALKSGNFEVAMAVFALAAVSDGLDGFLAKRFQWTSELGKLLDPAADKLLLVCVFVSATWLGMVPPWLTAAAVARDAMIALGALVFRVWFGPLRGRPTALSKLNTGLQLAYLLAVMSRAAFRFPNAPALSSLAVATLLTTILSGLDYIAAFTRRALAMPAAAR